MTETKHAPHTAHESNVAFPGNLVPFKAIAMKRGTISSIFGLSDTRGNEIDAAMEKLWGDKTPTPTAALNLALNNEDVGIKNENERLFAVFQIGRISVGWSMEGLEGGGDEEGPSSSLENPDDDLGTGGGL